MNNPLVRAYDWPRRGPPARRARYLTPLGYLAVGQFFVVAGLVVALLGLGVR